ncbi:NAD(P)-binding domain-containing protein [Leucobacter sp. GX24907]
MSNAEQHTSDQQASSRQEAATISLGVVGVGAIAADVTTAILSGPHADKVEAVLSPRSRARSAELAERFTQARVAESNQAVVDASDIVIIAVLPEQLAEVCSELTFSEHQTIVSLVASWPPSAIAPYVAPAQTICQMIPLPMITLGVGPIVLYQANAQIESLIEGCGEIVTLERENDVLVFNVLSAVMSTYFEVQNEIIDWGCSHDIDRERVTSYMTALFHGLGVQSTRAKADEMADMPVLHETPGGLNAQIREAFQRREAGAAIREDLESVHADRSTRSKG